MEGKGQELFMSDFNLQLQYRTNLVFLCTSNALVEVFCPTGPVFHCGYLFIRRRDSRGACMR